jgi:pSer/pThr/pTyr-binding forkhead associated (FHA) protein
VLGDDDVARAAHDLACRVHVGALPPGHLDVVPLPAAGAADSGPARLHFRGRDHLLSGAVFSLGRDPGCNLVFESELYPSVSGRHCEIVLDRRVYTLCDRSRHGTLVNDRPVSQQVPLRSGDWIQLGPEGPLLRFLGQAPGRPQLLTTA